VSASAQKIEGFGFDPEESQHYFLVSISSSKDADVHISEHMTWEKGMWDKKIRAVQKDTDERLRVLLARPKWDAIADAVTAEFNQRLKENDLKKGKWKDPGLTPVSRLFGKELILLAWAIEDADPGKIPAAITNWLGLTPEERWWLFTMTNAATGQALRGRNVGWRKAVRFALTENPLSAGVFEQRVGLIAGLDSEGREKKGKKKPHQETLTEFVKSSA